MVYGIPQNIVLPTSTIDFLGGNIVCPNKPDKYLRVLYGDFEEIVCDLSLIFWPIG